ncbi:MAG: phosphoribosyltransferase family protein [Thermoleophilia bacterium]|jgi:predicted phosphoribosyltransferase|nr:phosphoribosyltransferase family protein [Thermoleophilia bacterium]
MIVDDPALRDRAKVFRDRDHAGAVLAELLAPRFERRRDAAVFAIPAGGVPVAAPIARRLELPLDVAVVSKITLPWNTEAGYGAVAFDGSVRLNRPLLRDLGLTPEVVEEGVARTRAKVARRESVLRRGRPFTAVEGYHVVVVDDGLASGFTLRAAVAALEGAGASAISVAVPTAHAVAAREVAESVADLYCPNLRGGRSFAVADAYATWSDVGEDTVAAILASSSPPPSMPFNQRQRP